MTRTKITFFDMESPGEPANRAFITDGAGAVVLEYISISGHIHDHGVLSGLGDDDHLQYALLAGRTGGQILTGGDASGDDLELLSSSDGTKGFVRATEGLFYSGDWTATDGQVELRGGSTDLFGTVWVRAGFNAGSTRAWFGARNNEIMLSMGIAGIEGGDLGIYRDGSSNFGLYADADALEDATGLTVYGRIVVGETQPITIGGDNSVLSTGGTDIFTIAAGGNIIIDPTDTLQISGRTEIYGTLFVDNYTDVTEISEPGNPPTGEYRIYAETDGELYGKNDAGNETLLSLDNLGELENVDLTGETQDDHLAFDGSNWVPSGITAGVVDHGGLTGLSDDDHAQYLLLAGRSTGQTAFGGLDANDDLTLGSTANATKGTIFLEDPTIVGGTDIDPDAMFHVFVSETGATAGSLADDFILEASGHMGMSFLNDPGFNTSLQFFTIDGINAQIRSDPVGGEFQVQALGGNTLHLIGENMELETSVGGLIDVNSAADDADFRVQSSAVVNALFVQGSDGFVGIGTPIAPLYSLHIDENADASRAILLQAGGSTGRTASLLFKTSSNDSDEFIKGAVIFEDDGSSDARGTLHLATNIAASNANVSVADSRLMVDAQGFIGVGTVFPQSLFHASGVGTFNSYLDFQEIAAPATPNANFYRVYPKTDGELYGKNDSGDETLLSLNNLGELENVDLTGEGTNDHLAFDGSNWVPSGVSGGGISDHGLLTGLSDDDHAQYLLLAGRSGGQAADGGIDSGDDLDLQSTAHATKGTITMGTTPATKDGTVHIHTASAGSITAFASADNLVIEDSGNMGIQLLTADGNIQYFAFGDTSNNLQAYMQFLHATNTWNFVVGSDTPLQFAPTETVVNNGNADLDFRVASDTVVDALFVQGSDGFIGMGIGAPESKFHIQTATDTIMKLDVQAAGRTAQIEFDRGTSTFIGPTSGDEFHIFSFENIPIVIAQNNEEKLRMNSTDVIFNEQSLDINFRVESNDIEYMFFTDAGTNRAGFNTAFPQSLLHASGIVTMNDFLDMQEIAAPGTPASNFYRVYPKTDGEVYGKNDAGSEVLLSLDDLGELTNVDLTGETQDDHLAFDGSNWVPSGVTGGGGVTDHGALTGLADDDHAQYLLLAGRSGGQSAFGGTGAGDHLVLESTDDITRGNVILGNLTSSGRIDNLTDITGSGGIYIRGGSGDVNDDRVVDVLDVQLAANFVLGVSTPTRDQFLRADMDGDGTLTYTDHYLITRAFLGDPKSIKDQILPVGRTGTSAYTITFDTGINVITPDSRLHVVGTQGGLTGGYSADVTADTFHIENKANTGMTISSEDAGSGIITWGFPQDNVYHRLIGTGPSATTSGVVTLWVDNQEIVEWSAGSAVQAFQQAATISTTAGDLEIAPFEDLYLNANVGIGTNSPQAQLHLEGDGGLGGGRLILDNTAPSGERWDLISAHNAAHGVPDGTLLIYNSDAGANRVAISPEGEVGIDQDDPNQKFHIGNISGSGKDRGMEMSGERPFMFINHTGSVGFAGGLAFMQAGTTEMEFFYDTNTDTLLFWDTAGAGSVFDVGRTGQFVTRPQAGTDTIFNEDGVDANFRIESDDATDIFFADAGLDSGAGRVGINTNAPAATLDVVGVIKSDVPHDIPGDFTTWWVDAPPPSGYVYLGTEDDEFHDSSFDTGIWSEWDVPATLTVSEDDFGMYMTTTTSNNGQGIYQPVPPSITNWSFTTFMGPLFGQTGDQKQGIILLEDISAHSTTDAYIWSNFRGGAGYGWQATFLNAYNDFNTDDFNSVSDVRPAGMYLRVRVEGSTWHFDWSEDGYHWVLDRYTRAARFTAEGVGLGGRVSTTTDWRAPYKFARFQNNADDTQMLLGARVKGWYE